MGRSQSRRTRLIFVSIFAAWIAHDLLVPPRYAFDARATLAAIDEYRALVSPHLHGVIQCRFNRPAPGMDTNPSANTAS